MTLMSKLREDWALRPWWMNGLFYFCVYMTVYLHALRLISKARGRRSRNLVWFSLTGWWAKATEPLHWAIYAAGAYGFWRMRAWMWPWAVVYTVQVVIAMVVWNLVNVRRRNCFWLNRWGYFCCADGGFVAC